MADTHPVIEAVARAIAVKYTVYFRHVSDAWVILGGPTMTGGEKVFTGTKDECDEWVRLQPARAAYLATLRSIREPDACISMAGSVKLSAALGVPGWESSTTRNAVHDAWQASLDHLIAEASE